MFWVMYIYRKVNDNGHNPSELHGNFKMTIAVDSEVLHVTTPASGTI